MRRRTEQPAAEEATCSDYGTLCGPTEMATTGLEGQPGTWCYEQPKYYCRQCRRHFFRWPDAGHKCASDGLSRGEAESSLSG
ncbi:MAG TPA: hypothetical protein PK777_10730, partial [Thermoguttaceae bacterium]|nr:hypothetical protein [Thermoguttaceae bacterium]